MRRSLTSTKCYERVQQQGVVSEEALLQWAGSTPAATVRLYLSRLVSEGRLSSRTLQNSSNTVLYWAPRHAAAAVAVEENQHSDKKRERGAEEREEEGDEQLEQRIKELHWVNARYEQEVKQHIDRLHTYNELRDIAQQLIGRNAVLEAQTVKAIYPKYGLEVDD
jgi:hypothetical protein